MAFHWDVFLVQLGTFIVGMFLIWKLYFKPLGRHLSQRTDSIKKDLDDASGAREEAVKLGEEVKAQRAQLAAEGQVIIDKAKADAEALRDKALAKAKVEQEQVVAQARRQIEQEKENALREIRTESAELIIAATEKLVAKSLDRKKQEKLVAQFIKEVEPK
jgi:F-type H+-transporting ATPase subunit b